jgi:SAM-dependent methyltransferase
LPDDLWTQFYTQRAADYARLVAHEDFQGNLLKAIQAICPLAGKIVAEFGAGTGRVTRLLAAHAHWVGAFDRAPAMLGLAQRQLGASGVSNADLALGDHRCMPAAGGWADLAIEGWSFLHLKVWHPDTWLTEVGQAVGELERLARPGGDLIIIETLGTGRIEPHVPAVFQPFFQRLEGAWGFKRFWTRTDYRFDSLAQAQAEVGEAFGEALAGLERTPDGWLLPECTGLWHRRAQGRMPGAR